MFSYVMGKTCYIPWHDNEALIVLDKHDKLNWYFTSTLQQHLWLVVEKSLNMDTLAWQLDNQYLLFLLGYILITAVTNIKLSNNENNFNSGIK